MKFGYFEPAPRFVPHGVQPQGIVGRPETFPVHNAEFDGKFYQPHSIAEADRRREALAAHLSAFNDETDVKAFALMPLDLYQDWVELDWKAPHATVEANNRFAQKLLEEGVHEVGYELDRHDREEQKAKDKLADELGDGLWTSVAGLSNTGRHLNRAVARFLHREELAAAIVGVVRFIDVDYALANGFVPSPIRHSIAPDMVDPDDYESELDIRVDNFYTPALLRQPLLSVYEDIDRPDCYVFPGAFEALAKNFEAQFLEYFMLLGYTAQKRAGISLSEVAARNYAKLQGRVATNTVDKTDGTRV